MSYPQTIDIDLDDVDPNGIFTINTVAGAITLTLAGALVSGTVATMDYARQIGILSSGNDTGITFTVTGTDGDGRALSEVVTGASATTAESAGYFKTVTSIVTSGAAAANVTIGTVDEAVSNTYPLNHHASTGALISAVVTGTIDYTIEERFDDIQISTGLQSGWTDITAFADKTATVTSTATRGATAFRIVINSHSSGARLLTSITDRVHSD